jgi:hypothetical protein
LKPSGVSGIYDKILTMKGMSDERAAELLKWILEYMESIKDHPKLAPKPGMLWGFPVVPSDFVLEHSDNCKAWEAYESGQMKRYTRLRPVSA